MKVFIDYDYTPRKQKTIENVEYITYDEASFPERMMILTKDGTTWQFELVSIHEMEITE